MKMKHVFSGVSALLAITFAVGACDDDHDDYWGSGPAQSIDSCSENTACNTCTAANGCGWCFDGKGGGTCGSDANACNTEWTWEPNFCRAAADASVSTSTEPSDADAATNGDADAATSSDADADADGD